MEFWKTSIAKWPLAHRPWPHETHRCWTLQGTRISVFLGAGFGAEDSTLHRGPVCERVGFHVHLLDPCVSLRQPSLREQRHRLCCCAHLDAPKSAQSNSFLGSSQKSWTGPGTHQRARGVPQAKPLQADAPRSEQVQRCIDAFVEVGKAKGVL